MQKGSALPLGVVVGILIILVGLGGYYFYRQQQIKSINSFEDCAKHYPVMESYPEQCATPNGKHFTRELTEEEKQRMVSPQEVLQNNEETANWKTYTNDYFSFKYPDNWYFEKNPNSTSTSFSFFKEGAKVDHGYADHQGNEVFSFELSEDQKSLSQLKSEYYPEATDLLIDGKNALKTSFGLIIIKVDSQKTLNIVTGLPGAKDFSEEIISSFKFL